MISWVYKSPTQPTQQPSAEARCQAHCRIRLLALSVTLARFHDLPTISASSVAPFKSRLHRAINGHSSRAQLLMSKLQRDDQARLHQALEDLPDHFIDHNNIKTSIFDTGATYTSTGFIDDFIPGTLMELDTPIKLDGIAGSLTATQKGIIHHHVLTSDGSKATLDMEAMFMPGLSSRLISPQKLLWSLAQPTVSTPSSNTITPEPEYVM